MNQIERGFARYIDSEILPSINQGGLTRIAIGTAAGVLVQRAGRAVEAYVGNPAFRALGLTDEAHNVDIDILVSEFRKNIPDEGSKVRIPNPLTGTDIVAMTFKREDVDRLYQFIAQS
jgi:hypothetical protein